MKNVIKQTLLSVTSFLKRCWLLVLSLLLLIGWFYWFQWRPTHIRSLCQKNAFDVLADSIKLSKDFSFDDGQKTLKHLYEVCLHKHGIAY